MLMGLVVQYNRGIACYCIDILSDVGQARIALSPDILCDLSLLLALYATTFGGGRGLHRQITVQS